MVTTQYRSKAYITDGKVHNNVCDVYCLSGYTKPTDGIGNGSILIEMDTSKVYIFDEENIQWQEL